MSRATAIMLVSCLLAGPTVEAWAAEFAWEKSADLSEPGDAMSLLQVAQAHKASVASAPVLHEQPEKDGCALIQYNASSQYPGTCSVQKPANNDIVYEQDQRSCKLLCSWSSTCTGLSFTWDSSRSSWECTIHRSPIGGFTYTGESYPECWYNPCTNPSNCAPLPEIGVPCREYNIDYEGQDLHNITNVANSYDCKSLCQSDFSCQYFSYSTHTKICYFKHKDTGRITKCGFISGRKQC